MLGRIADVPPRTNSRLKMFDPTTLPTARSVCMRTTLISGDELLLQRVVLGEINV